MAWSQFYGTIRGKAQTEATRCGDKSSGLRVLGASKTGAIIVRLWEHNGVNRFEITLTDWGASKFEPICLAVGSFPAGEGEPDLMLFDPAVRKHIEREALKAMTKEEP